MTMMESPPRSLAPGEETTFLERLVAGLGRRINRANVVPIALGLVMAAGLGDAITGIDVTFTLAYVIPLSLATWFHGRRFGWFIAVVASALSLATSITGWSNAHTSIAAIAWNNAGAFGLFAIMVEALDRLRRYVEMERRERRIAVEQLRHGERLQVIGKLAAGIAHELGTPLNVIAGHAEMLADSRRTPQGIDTSAEAILSYTRRMTTLIRQLLDFGRRGGAMKASINLAEVAAVATKMLEHSAAKAGCRIVLENSAEPVTALANATEIEQVVTNLVMNAVHAMPKGGTIRVCTSVEEHDSIAQIAVEDEGVGISKEDLSRVFDPFFTTKGVGEGTGLGLAVSYGIVHDHGGRMDVRSDVGHGARFIIQLPCAR